MPAFVDKFLSSQFAKTSLRTGFQQPKLSLGQTHFRTDLILTLFIDVEACQDLSISLRKLSQDLADEPYPLAEHRRFLRVSAGIDYPDGGIEFRLFAAVVNHFIDMGSHLAANDSANESH